MVLGGKCWFRHKKIRRLSLLAHKKSVPISAKQDR